MSVLHIDNAAQGREMLRRIIPHVAPAVEWWVPTVPAWFGIVFTYHGLKALGLPQESLDSFPEEFRQGMERGHRFSMMLVIMLLLIGNNHLGPQACILLSQFTQTMI